MPWPINVPGIEWITRALKLRSGDAPRQLIEEISPTLDVMQGGQGLASWEFVSFSRDSTSPNTQVIVERDPNSICLVWGGGAKSGAAATIDMRVQTLPPNASTASASLWRNPAIADTTLLQWNVIGGGMQWWVVPPGFQLRLLFSALTAPDTFEGRFIICRVPGGFKPW